MPGGRSRAPDGTRTRNIHAGDHVDRTERQKTASREAPQNCPKRSGDDEDRP